MQLVKLFVSLYYVMYINCCCWNRNPRSNVLCSDILRFSNSGLKDTFRVNCMGKFDQGKMRLFELARNSSSS